MTGSVEGFLSAAREAPHRLVLLDYDGTLAPFAADRAQALPYPGVPAALGDLARRPGTRVVVISGRPALEVVGFLGLDPAPEVWGCHGWERRDGEGRREVFRPPPAAAEALARAAQAVSLPAGSVETKPVGMAFHHRGRPPDEAAALTARVRAAWEPLAAAGGLLLAPFDGGLELRVPGRDKGRVVTELLAGAPAGSAVAYLGDDATDEDAFRSLRGKGLGVLVRSEPRPTAAQARLVPPQEVLAFLRAVAGTG